MREFKQQGAVFSAVCDMYEPNRTAGAKEAIVEGSENKIAEYTDWREMLEKQKDMDAVVIASPEHLHCEHLIGTVQAGFDSYCEKPMSHSIEEGMKMVKAVRKTDRIVQIGMQRRSTPFVRKGKEIMDTGVLGPVHFVRVKWNWTPLQSSFLKVDNSELPGGMSSEQWRLFCGKAGRIKYEPKMFRHWRWFWAFSGGNITDQGTHLMDVVQWYMGKEFDPVTPQYAECFGDVYYLKGVETPDVFTSIYQYPTFTANWSLNYTTSYQNSWSIEFMGEKATMALDDKGLRVYEETWEPAAGSMLESKKAPKINETGGLESISHVGNFLDCVKSRNEPNAPVEIGHKAVCGPHLANVAYHRKERAHLNADATKVNWNLF